MKNLFNNLFHAPTENSVNEVIQNNPIFHDPNNWHPYGDTESNFSVVENQQANPVPALVEKLTNSIDAILMKKCFEAGIDPRSNNAPKNMEKAVHAFFDYENFDLQTYRNNVAEDIQILADPNSPKMNSSLIIYDNGEGQHPQDFPNTFLSLLRGNKNDIKFVQGKYNMGGAGAIVYCGESRYQLVGSKRYDNSGNFGFTIVRIHPITKEEETTRKNTFYEYFCPDGKIAEFPIDELDLNLYKKNFKTGTVIKLYSYDLPPGSRSVISRDLNQSVNEYLHNPALPIYIIDRKERYPLDIALERVMFGLSKRLSDQKDKYVDRQFSLDINDGEIGNLKATVTVFKVKNEGKTAKEFKSTIQNEFFKNNMSVAFSLNGQVHGFYSSEFITRALKYKLLKDYLLIHVDCTNVRLHYRNNLFMASRDRLKNGKEADNIRTLLARKLKQSELNDIYKQRKDSFSSDTEDTSELLKSFSKNLPLNPEMLKLLKQTFKLDLPDDAKKDNKKKKDKKTKKTEPKEPFISQRYPSIFKIDGKPDKDGKVTKIIPLGGDRTVRFSTDVENEYFDRIRDKGELKLYILKHAPNDATGGDAPGKPREIDDYFEVVKSSPQEGTIRVNLQSKDSLNIGDELAIKAKLTSVVDPEGALEALFYIKIERKQEKEKKPEDPEPLQIGLPNMGSILFKSYKSQFDGDEQLKVADNKYISQVYFHSLFLYSILKQRNYIFSLGSDNNQDKTLEEVLRDLFKSSYGEFLLKFGGTEELMTALD